MIAEDELITKAVMWAYKSAEAIHSAGGSAGLVLRLIPKDLLATLVRNDIFLSHTRVGGK